MMFRGRSLRWQLWSIVGMTLASFIAIAVVDNVTTERLDEELDTIEGDYVPLLQYGPEVQAALNGLRRGMQDAVTARDAEQLQQTVSERTLVLQLLDDAPRVIERKKIEDLRRAFLEWSERAYQLSEVLLQGETGESLLPDIEAMQELQREMWALLNGTVFLDEVALARAFENTRRAQQTATRTRRGFHIALLIGIATMMLLIGRRLLSAISKLKHGFARFGGGDFSEPVLISGNDELTELSNSANDMAERIDSLQRGLKEKQLALEQVNRELESFSYSVSHDLRTPLRGIDGFSQALLEDYEAQLDETGQGYLHRVRAAAQRMGELIDDLLALSRIGRTDVKRQHVDVTALATRVISQLKESDSSREVEWIIADGITADADRRLLMAALENLLGNAWKFTSKRAQARIEFGRQPEGEEDAYFVRDNGAGFDMAYADKLFGAFQRLHSGTDFAGTGIGLATVNRIIHKHGGRIWAESEVDCGATFFFTLEPVKDEQWKT